MIKLDMYIFSLLISLGAILGLYWVVSDLKEKQAFRFIDNSLGILLGGLIGSRTVFITVHWSYYQDHVLEILQVWTGGFSALGAIAGVFVAWLILSGINRLDPALLADQLVPLFMLVSVATWLGSWLEGVAYGPITMGGRWSFLARDEWGVFAARFPTQLLGAVLTLGWFWFIESLRKWRKMLPGWTAVWGFLGVSVIFTGLSFLRADPTRYWQGLRLDTWAGFSLCLLSVICIFWRWRVKQT